MSQGHFLASAERDGLCVAFSRDAERIVYARTRRKLPVILSADEVVRFLEAVLSLKAHCTDHPMPRGCAPRRW